MSDDAKNAIAKLRTMTKYDPGREFPAALASIEHEISRLTAQLAEKDREIERLLEERERARSFDPRYYE